MAVTAKPSVVLCRPSFRGGACNSGRTTRPAQPTVFLKENVVRPVIADEAKDQCNVEKFASVMELSDKKIRTSLLGPPGGGSKPINILWEPRTNADRSLDDVERICRSSDCLPRNGCVRSASPILTVRSRGKLDSVRKNFANLDGVWWLAI